MKCVPQSFQWRRTCLKNKSPFNFRVSNSISNSFGIATQYLYSYLFSYDLRFNTLSPEILLLKDDCPSNTWIVVFIYKRNISKSVHCSEIFLIFSKRTAHPGFPWFLLKYCCEVAIEWCFFGCIFQFWSMYLRSMFSSMMTQMPCSSH